MLSSALQQLQQGAAALSTLATFVENKTGLPLTITTDEQSATPPCVLVSMPRTATFGINGGEGRAGFLVALILPFFEGGIADVLHAVDLFGGELYAVTPRASDGTRLIRVEVEDISEAKDRSGIWVVSLICEFAY